MGLPLAYCRCEIKRIWDKVGSGKARNSGFLSALQNFLSGVVDIVSESGHKVRES
jgi:hypothetical protein